MAKRGSPEWRKKISDATKGRPGPKYWLGKKLSDKHKINISKVNKGKNNPRYGAKLSEEHKLLLAKKRDEYYKVFGVGGEKYVKKTRPKTSLALMGHKHSEETKRKIGLKSALRCGENHPNWQGGKTSINRRKRNCKKYLDWRKAVLERDNYTCQECGVVGGQLEVHHIKSFSEHPECRYDINNGVTYHVTCHAKHDNYRKISLPNKLRKTLCQTI